MKALKRETEEDEEKLEELKEKFHVISLEKEKCESNVESRLTRWKIGGCLFVRKKKKFKIHFFFKVNNPRSCFS